jgi:hypothetical protein
VVDARVSRTDVDVHVLQEAELSASETDRDGCRVPWADLKVDIHQPGPERVDGAHRGGRPVGLERPTAGDQHVRLCAFLEPWRVRPQINRRTLRTKPDQPHRVMQIQTLADPIHPLRDEDHTTTITDIEITSRRDDVSQPVLATTPRRLINRRLQRRSVIPDTITMNRETLTAQHHRRLVRRHHLKHRLRRHPQRRTRRDIGTITRSDRATHPLDLLEILPDEIIFAGEFGG